MDNTEQHIERARPTDTNRRDGQDRRESDDPHYDGHSRRMTIDRRYSNGRRDQDSTHD